MSRPKKLYELPADFEIDNSPIQWGKGSPYGWGYDGEVTKELWKPVTRYRDLEVVEGYWVSNYCRIYSTITGDLLSPGKNSVGRPYVMMRCTDGKRHNMLIYRLVLEAWVKNPLPKLLRGINHKDGNMYNNRLDNLEYTNQQANTQHYWKEIYPHLEESKSKKTGRDNE